MLVAAASVQRENEAEAVRGMLDAESPSKAVEEQYVKSLSTCRSECFELLSELICEVETSSHLPPPADGLCTEMTQRRPSTCWSDLNF